MFNGIFSNKYDNALSCRLELKAQCGYLSPLLGTMGTFVKIYATVSEQRQSCKRRFSPLFAPSLQRLKCEMDNAERGWTRRSRKETKDVEKRNSRPTMVP